MALTMLDPDTALIIVDLQKGIVGLPTVHPMAGVIERARALIDAFREHGLPVVLVNVAGGAPGRTEQPRPIGLRPDDWSDLIPQLDRQPGDIAVTKRTWGAFASTDLEARLKARGVTQVVIGGVATGTGVEATARQAYDQGYNVVLVTDAMTDLDPETHRHAVEKVFPRIGERTTTAELVAKLKLG